MIRLKKDDHPDRPDLSPWLGTLYVHSFHRKQGLAACLCRWVEDRARNDYGFRQIYLFTHNAEKFYERLGWARIGDVRDPMGLGPPEALMMKVLN